MIFGGFQALRQCKGRGPKKYGSSDAWWQKSWKNFISFWIPSLIINDILCNKVDFWGKLVGWVPITSDDNNTESERWETSPPHMHPAIYTFNKFDKDGDLEMIHMCDKSANLGVYFLPPMHPATYTFLTNFTMMVIWKWFICTMWEFTPPPLASTCPTFFQTALHILMFWKRGFFFDIYDCKAAK